MALPDRVGSPQARAERRSEHGEGGERFCGARDRRAVALILEVDGEPADSVDSLVVKTLKMKAGDVVQLK
jgi:hypothetical protein